MEAVLISTLWVIVPVIVGVAVLLGLNQWTGFVVRIPNDKIGVVEKLFSARGASLKSGFIALSGEPGFHPDVLRGGLHLLFPFFYRVHKMPLVTISQGKIGYVFARDGKSLAASQTLAINDLDEDFQDVRRFLQNGGQKGPQRRFLREGTYAINLAQFIVLTEDSIHGVALDDLTSQTLASMATTLRQREGFSPVIIRDADDKIGIVTVHDGPSLPSGVIIAPEVGGTSVSSPNFHDSFQKPEAFIAAGGYRGRQLQTLVEGTYFINRLFATIDLIPKTVIEIGMVGVVVSYAGDAGTNTLDADYKHGQLVERGKRGVWADPLLPGKYSFNTFAGKIVMIPTTNFMLKWDANAAASSHRLDDNLSEIALITKDAFEPILPLSVVLHIPYQKAPELVQRFGDIKRLVEQTLDPMVSSYFKNIAQTKMLTEILQQRNEIQQQASEDMKGRFANYTLEFQEVLIGTPRPREGDTTIETILLQLRQRQVAAEQIETYRSQQAAAAQERELNEAKAAADRQTALTQSKVDIEIKTNQGSAEVALAAKQAEVIRVTAQAAADRTRMQGEGEAAAITVVGLANATAIEKQVAAYSGAGAEFRLAEQISDRLFNAVSQGHQPLVPQIVVSGGTDGVQANPGALVSGLLASLLRRDVAPEVHQN